MADSSTPDARPQAHWASSPSGFALLVFVVTAIWLLLTHGGIGVLLSLNGLFFVFAGAIAALLIIGIPFYLVQLGMGKWLYRVLGDRTDSGAVRLVKTLVTVLMAAQMVVTFMITQWAFKRIFLGD